MNSVIELLLTFHFCYTPGCQHAQASPLGCCDKTIRCANMKKETMSRATFPKNLSFILNFSQNELHGVHARSSFNISH